MRSFAAALLVLFVSSWSVAADTLRLGDNATHRVSLRVAPEGGDAPGEILLRAKDDPAAWSAALTADDLRALRTLVVPAGRYELVVKLERHRRVTRDITPGDANLGTIVIPASPAIRGMVVDAKTAKPLAGVRVKIDHQVTDSDADGRFALFASDEWPADVMLSRKGLGTKQVFLPVAPADIDLGRIAMERGGSLRVQIARGKEKGALTVRIAKRAQNSALTRLRGVKTLRLAESSVVFDDLDAGTHLVLIEGDEPLKRLRTLGVVDAGTTRPVRVEIPHSYVYGRFTIGGRPLANAGVMLTHTTEAWTAKLRTKADGSYAGVMWRRGEFDVAVSIDGADAMTVGTLVIPEGATNVDFDMPDRSVTARVVTANGAPVPNVLVALESAGPPRRVIRKATDSSGVVSYIGVPAGRQALRVVAAEGWLRPDALELEMSADETHYDARIKLLNGDRRTVDVVDHHDVPREGATILCLANGEIRSSATTNDRGRAEIDTPPAGDATLYVIPREGSLAVRRVASAMDDERDTIRVRVPPAGAAIDLVAKSTDGAALAEVAFLMRFNGEIVPAEVVREMQLHQGARLMTDDDGRARLPNVPPGLYEFWPFRTDDEATAILETAGVLDPPIRLDARSGENRVTVHFERRP